MREVSWLGWIAALASCTAVTGTAQAFCRTTSDKNPPNSCGGQCDTAGYPLAWPESAITYTLHERGFPALDDVALRAALAGSFAQWQAVSCDGEPIGLEIEAASETTSLWVRPERESPTTNVIGHLTEEEWAEEDFDTFVFALTKVRFDLKSGRIVGADTWFNGGLGSFQVCPEQGCDPLGDAVDLPNVATHEAGHWLGLAHSGAAGATMACRADPAETDKRTLEQDDRDGLCAIYPPSVAFMSDYLKGDWTAAVPHVHKSGSCAVVPRAQGAAARWLPGVSLLLLLLAYRRLRARRP